jgi:diaminopimelate epimerase
MEITVMNGAGNDFVVLDARGKDLDFTSLAIKLCKEYGTDGLLAADVSDKADFKLHFYNPDGLRGEMCGNGARCICKFAYDNGLAGEAMTVETDAGLVYGWRLEENRYKVKLNNPGFVDLNRR